MSDAGFFIGVLLVVLVSVVTIKSTPSRSERAAQRNACEELAAMTRTGEVKLEAYLATRCKAGLLERYAASKDD